MEIRIQPLDTLFFRDGKPFTMGEETWADSSLLPSPSVIYGALRTAIAIENKISFDDLANNSKLNDTEFSITKIYYNVVDKNTLPLPLDLVEYEKEEEVIEEEKENKVYEVKPLEIVSFTSIFSKSKSFTKYALIAKDFAQVENFENGLIQTTEFQKYLSGNLQQTGACKLRDFIKEEPKLGIGRDDSTKTSEDGQLFRTDMKRSVEFYIGVEFKLEGYNHLSSLVRLGGEGKIVHLSTTEPTRIANRPIRFANRFKIYFATPAILIKGKPNLSKLGIDAQLVAACVGKPLSIGGFNMKEGKAKKMYKTVPAGSVFYYETENDLSSLNNNQGISLSDEQSEQGFGIAYFGIWHNSTLK